MGVPKRRLLLLPNPLLLPRLKPLLPQPEPLPEMLPDPEKLLWLLPDPETLLWLLPDPEPLLGLLLSEMLLLPIKEPLLWLLLPDSKPEPLLCDPSVSPWTPSVSSSD